MRMSEKADGITKRAATSVSGETTAAKIAASRSSAFTLPCSPRAAWVLSSLMYGVTSSPIGMPRSAPICMSGRSEPSSSMGT